MNISTAHGAGWVFDPDGIYEIRSDEQLAEIIDRNVENIFINQYVESTDDSNIF
jgi:hypothetical protein